MEEIFQIISILDACVDVYSDLKNSKAFVETLDFNNSSTLLDRFHFSKQYLDLSLCVSDISICLDPHAIRAQKMIDVMKENQRGQCIHVHSHGPASACSNTDTYRSQTQKTALRS